MLFGKRGPPNTAVPAFVYIEGEQLDLAKDDLRYFVGTVSCRLVTAVAGRHGDSPEDRKGNQYSKGDEIGSSPRQLRGDT